MSRFRPIDLIPHYRRTSTEDVPLADYAAQLVRCQSCPQRVRGNCRLADQPVQIIARKANRTCPLDRAPSLSVPQGPVYAEAEPRTIQRVAAVCCHYNPCGYERLEANYHRFAAALPPELDLWTIELAYDRQPYRLPDGPRMLRVRGTAERHTLWQKERLLNLAISAVPEDYDAIAWLDADLLWLNPDWLTAACQQLAQYRVVQLFEHVSDTDPAGRITRKLPGHVHARCTGQAYGRPGGAWVARRDALPVGLYDRHVIGGGDSALLYAWDACAQLPPSLQYGPAWQSHYLAWAHRAGVGSSLAAVPGTVLHLYHGTRENRRYVDRYRCLQDHAYDPAGDVEIDPQTGLLQWTDRALSEKPEMVRQVAEYFALRREDD